MHTGVPANISSASGIGHRASGIGPSGWIGGGTAAFMARDERGGGTGTPPRSSRPTPANLDSGETWRNAHSTHSASCWLPITIPNSRAMWASATGLGLGLGLGCGHSRPARNLDLDQIRVLDDARLRTDVVGEGISLDGTNGTGVRLSVGRFFERLPTSPIVRGPTNSSRGV